MLRYTDIVCLVYSNIVEYDESTSIAATLIFSIKKVSGFNVSRDTCFPEISCILLNYVMKGWYATLNVATAASFYIISNLFLLLCLLTL
jgi:hypothetical protein